MRDDLLICVDHEGGRVQRFRTDGFTHLPPMRALGELWMHDAMRAQDAATACGYVLAAELRACGVDFSFTPVLDLDWGPSGVIGDRAFHADARVVAMLAKSVMHGLLRAGMGNCGKHFPGHGFVAADSHTDLPRDRRSLKAILADDAAPYGWLGMSLDAVMAAFEARKQDFADAVREEMGAPAALATAAHVPLATAHFAVARQVLEQNPPRGLVVVAHEAQPDEEHPEGELLIIDRLFLGGHAVLFLGGRAKGADEAGVGVNFLRLGTEAEP